jgi:hypothetical protein
MFIKKSIILLSLIIPALLIFNFSSCEDSPTESGNTNTVLSFEDVSCTEAWVKISANGLHLPNTIHIYKNDSLITALLLNTKDSLLYFDNLLPDKTYKIRARIKQYNQQSNELTFTTMDTTSHNFTWQTFSFGEVGSSTLYDVAIIDENNIWAVGEIYMNDSLGNPDPKFYNLIKWNGTEWKPERIYFTNSQGQSFLAPMKSIFAFSENDIWIGLDQLIHWDGSDYIEYELSDAIFQSWINKIWGTSSEDLYVVGNGGNIAHYDGKNWQKIESGTSLNIGDIFGVLDGNGGYNKYCAAGGVMLIINHQNEATRINVEPNTFLSSIWGKSNRVIYTAGDGVVLYKNNKWEKINRPDVKTIYCIKGNNYNDVFGLSSTLLILHFNGYSWQYINTLNIIYYRLDVKDNIMAAVGWQSDKAVITVLKRKK